MNTQVLNISIRRGVPSSFGDKVIDKTKTNELNDIRNEVKTPLPC